MNGPVIYQDALFSRFTNEDHHRFFQLPDRDIEQIVGNASGAITLKAALDTYNVWKEEVHPNTRKSLLTRAVRNTNCLPYANIFGVDPVSWSKKHPGAFREKLQLLAAVPANPAEMGFELGAHVIDDSVQHMRRNSYHAGYCPLAHTGHMDVLERNKKAIFIANEAGIIGALKLEGDHSMLALKTIQRSDGTHPLVQGAAYRLSYDNLEAIYKQVGIEDWEKNDWRDPTEEIIVTLPYLWVQPLLYVYNGLHEINPQIERLRSEREHEYIKNPSSPIN